MISHNFPSYTEKVAGEAFKQLKNGNFSRRHISHEAELIFSNFTNSKYTRLVSSGFAAIQAALIAVGVRKGEEVTIPNITCPSVYHAILSIGATPHVIDVGDKAPLLNTETLKIWKVKKYCIIPNMFGLRAEIDILEFPNVIFIEDNAQCLSPTRSEWATISIYSFSPTKILTIGYSGAVVTNEEQLKRKIDLFLDCDYHIPVITDSDNYNIPFRIHADISDFQAAMLLEQLNRYESIIAHRMKLAKIYDDTLIFSRIHTDVPFRYLLKINNFNIEKCIEILKRNSISSMPLGSHLLSEVFNLPDKYPNSYYWRRNLLSLPLHEQVEEDDVNLICNIINEHFK